jgi:hypothetical protein
MYFRCKLTLFDKKNESTFHFEGKIYFSFFCRFVFICLFYCESITVFKLLHQNKLKFWMAGGKNYSGFEWKPIRTRLEIISVRVSEKARSGKFRHHIETKWFFLTPHRKRCFISDVVSEKTVKFRCGVGIFRYVPFPIPERKLFLTV